MYFSFQITSDVAGRVDGMTEMADGINMLLNIGHPCENTMANTVVIGSSAH
jgi:hypothetical protein